NGIITVLNNSTIENVKLIISDVYGRTVLQTQNLENIDMVHFGSGVYFVKIYSKSHMLGTIKFNLIK
ncbi:MAG: T9SS type A sorting domain-containing protein, partial [Bacteroidia bacterium]